MASNGWIKLYRNFLDWEWYDNPEMVRLFLHILLKANHKPKYWHGILIETGQLLTSRKTLAKELNFSEQTVRTCLNRLKSTSEITSTSTSKYTIITVEKFNFYQFSNQQTNQQTNQQLTSNQPATNQQLTTTNKYKNEKNDKNVIKKDTNVQNQKNNFELEFEVVWKTYPRKQSKKVAMQKYNKLPLKTKKLIVEVLPAHIQYWKDAGTLPEHIPHFSTWINQKRWEDELIQPSKQPKKIAFKYDSTGKVIGWCSKCNKSSFYEPFNVTKVDSVCCSSELLFKKPEDSLKEETGSKSSTDTKSKKESQETPIYKPRASKYKIKYQDNMDGDEPVMIRDLIFSKEEYDE